MARRDQDTVFFDHEGAECLDVRYHRRCAGRWRGVIDLGRDGSGRRRRKKISGRSKSDVIAKLKAVRDELDKGIKAKPNYTVQNAVDHWLEHGLDGRSATTVATNKLVLAPLMWPVVTLVWVGSAGSLKVATELRGDGSGPATSAFGACLGPPR